MPDEHGEVKSVLVEVDADTPDGPARFRFTMTPDAAGLFANELQHEAAEVRHAGLQSE